MNRIKTIINFPRIIPHIVFYILSKRSRILINSDLNARPQYQNAPLPEDALMITRLSDVIVNEPEFRNIFYKRIGAPRHILNLLLPQISSMRLPLVIGKGFCPIHSYSTIINGGAKIGQNCTIYHSVTIAVEKSGVPSIGNNVIIGAGAIIMGGITIGNDVKIGAGAIVVDNVPDNSTVVCQKARIIPATK